MTSTEFRSLYAIVDDEPSMAQLVSDMLSSANVDVETFSRGGDFLRCANLQKFRAVILDLSIPDIDGFELMAKLAANLVSMPILLMSGRDSATIDAAEIYGRGIGLTICGALTKPFTKDQLFSGLGLPT